MALTNDQRVGAQLEDTLEDSLVDFELGHRFVRGEGLINGIAHKILDSLLFQSHSAW